jgi:hypothetical protein
MARLQGSRAPGLQVSNAGSGHGKVTGQPTFQRYLPKYLGTARFQDIVRVTWQDKSSWYLVAVLGYIVYSCIHVVGARGGVLYLHDLGSRHTG